MIRQNIELFEGLNTYIRVYNSLIKKKHISLREVLCGHGPLWVCSSYAWSYASGLLVKFTLQIFRAAAAGQELQFSSSVLKLFVGH